jgi:hypothetical protein
MFEDVVALTIRNVRDDRQRILAMDLDNGAGQRLVLPVGYGARQRTPHLLRPNGSAAQQHPAQQESSRVPANATGCKRQRSGKPSLVHIYLIQLLCCGCQLIPVRCSPKPREPVHGRSRGDLFTPSGLDVYQGWAATLQQKALVKHVQNLIGGTIIRSH